MRLLKKIFIIFFVFGTGNFSLAQNEIYSDSTKKDFSLNEYKLLMNFETDSPLLLIKPNFGLYDEEVLFIPTIQSDVLDEMKFRSDLKNQLSNSLQIFRQGLNKNDLGVVGEILGYTNAAAAIGLAAYHVYKYRKEYGLTKSK